jgi:membrane-associated phospholipid phosphatase
VTQRSKSSVWRRHSLRDRALNALLAAGACVVGLVWLYVAAFHVAATAQADERVLVGFLSFDTPETRLRASFVTEFFNPQPFAVAVVIVLAAALWVGRVRLAAAVGAIFIGANVTTQLLKTLTAAPRDPSWLPDASWPSGHVTAAASLALCVVLIAPSALRRYAAAAGAVGVLAAAYSILVIGSHHPSDVLGGMLVAGAWTGGAVAVMELAEQRWPSARGTQRAGVERRALWPAVAVSVAALLALVAAVGPLRPYLAEHTTFVTGALVLAASAAALPAAVATLLGSAVRGR